MIKARVKAENSDANLKSYYDTYKSFDWAEEEKESFHTADGHINIAAEAIDKWADNPLFKDKAALIFKRAGPNRFLHTKTFRSGLPSGLICLPGTALKSGIEFSSFYLAVRRFILPFWPAPRPG